MRRILLLLSLLAFSVFSDAKSAQTCADRRLQKGKHMLEKMTLASPLLEQYDVLHVKLDLSLSNASTQISGSATTTAKVIANTGMAQYAFELSEYLTIDSVRFNGLSCPYSRVDTDVFALTPAAIVLNGQTFQAQIFYHGTPPSGNGFFTHGLVNKTLFSGTKITFSLSDAELAKEWWPSKQTLNDKIDSAEMWFTVPGSLMAGSNGLLQRVTPMTGGELRYEWKTNYPIEYYLISVAVAPYARHDQMLHFSGSSDSMLLQHFVYDTARLYPIYKAALDSTPQIVDHFSALFGRYPFWKEKYGHCIAPLSGGMEHQTMTTMTDGVTTTLIAHELGHQWWGDCVTFNSWKDIWMSEGWAAYSEQLFLEYFRGKTTAKNYRSAVYSRVMAKPGGSVYVDDTTDIFRIFDYRLTYDKGAAVAHMLRNLAPDSATFFGGLRNYQNLYAFKTAGTTDFQLVMEAAFGRDLDTFFNQWIYGEGYPTFTLTWNQKGSDVFLQLEQTTSAPASVPCFSVPLQFKLSSATADTLIEVYTNKPVQMFRLNWSKAINSVVIDPEDELVNRANPVLFDGSLSVLQSKVDALSIYPNPTNEEWHLKKIPAGASLGLYNAAGQLKWECRQAPDTLSIPAASLSAGTYILRVRHSGKSQSYNLEKR